MLKIIKKIEKLKVNFENSLTISTQINSIRVSLCIALIVVYDRVFS